MLRYALLFLILALVCGVLGFTSVLVGPLLWVAKVFFVLFIVAFIVSLFNGSNRYSDPLA